MSAAHSHGHGRPRSQPPIITPDRDQALAVLTNPQGHRNDVPDVRAGRLDRRRRDVDHDPRRACLPGHAVLQTSHFYNVIVTAHALLMVFLRRDGPPPSRLRNWMVR